MKSNKIKRINWIDWARAICIYLVVLGHTFYPKPEDFKLYEIKNFIYSFHVPLFFFLSGFLHKVQGNFIDFIKQNVRGLIIPYILLNIIVFIIFVIPFYFIGQIDIERIKQLCFSFLIGEGHAPAGPCWFLLSLFFVKLFAYFILKHIYIYQIISVFISSFIAYVISYVLKIDLYFGFDTALIAIIFYIIGYHVKIRNIVNTLSNKLILLISFLISLCFLIFINKIQGRVDIADCIFGNYPLLYIPESLLGCFMVVIFCKLLDNIELKMIKVISLGTITILAFHSYLPFFIHKVIQIFKIDINFNIFFYISISFIMILILYYPSIFIRKYCPFIVGNRK